MEREHRDRTHGLSGSGGRSISCVGGAGLGLGSAMDAHMEQTQSSQPLELKEAGKHCFTGQDHIRRLVIDRAHVGIRLVWLQEPCFVPVLPMQGEEGRVCSPWGRALRARVTGEGSWFKSPLEGKQSPEPASSPSLGGVL